MPTEKRQRQRELRQAKIAERERHQRRVRTLRRGGTVIVAIGVVIGLIVLLSSPSSKKTNKTSSRSTTSTTKSSTVSSTPASSTGSKLVTVSTPVAPTCPPASGTAKRYIKFSAAPPNCLTAGASYTATVRTDVGSFVVRLLTSSSKAAVNNFVFLARNHFYDGTIFHRVIPGFMDQGGDPTGTGTGGPGYSWTGNTPPASCQTSGNCYPPGTMAMANSGSPSSNGSQFFIMAGHTQLAPSYTILGKVVSGMSIVNKINADGNANPAANGVPPKVTHHIVSVTIHQS